MILTRRAGWLLVAFGGWSWLIWPTFVRNIWKDGRSWHDGPTAFFLAHAVLSVVSLMFGTAIGWLGWRAARAASDHAKPVAPELAAAGTAHVGSPDQGVLHP